MIEILTEVFAAGETKTFMVQGEYIEILDAPSPVDVFMMDRSGAQLSTMRNAEASFFSRPGKYEVVQVYSAAAQTVRLFIGSGDAGTRRTSGVVQVQGTVATMGTVEVVDGGKARTLALNTFSSGISRVPVAGQFAGVQLHNISADKRLVINQITLQSTNADGMGLYYGVAAMATDAGFVLNKKQGGPASVNAKLKTSTNVAFPGAGLALFQINLPASGSFTYKLTEPLILPPGATLSALASTVTNSIGASFELYEEANT